MVKKRSLLAIAGAVLLIGSVAPLALAQSPEPSPTAETEVTVEASPAQPVELTQEQFDDILAQLTGLTARVEALEAELAELAAAATDGEPASGKGTTKPKAPVATGDTGLRYTVNDPNPKRGSVTWKDRADDEDGYRIYAKRVYCGLVDGADPNQALDYDDFTKKRSKAVRVGKVAADKTEFRPVHEDVTSQLPDQPKPLYGSGVIYELHVAAYNEAGESKRVPVGSYMTTPEFVCP